MPSGFGPASDVPEHPYERLYPRRVYGMIIIIVITIICSLLAIIIIFMGLSKSISSSDRSLGLFIVLIIWVILTGIISKITTGRFMLGLSGPGRNFKDERKED